MAHHPPPQWDAASGLLVGRFRHGPLWNFSYLIADEATGEATVIDPAWDAAGIVAAAVARGLRITTVLLTHSHSDHANGVAEVAAATGARVFVHAADAAGLEAHFGHATTFAGREEFALGPQAVVARPTPGHTAGSVTYSVDGRLFTGDTLAIGSPGTPGPERGSLERLWESTALLGGEERDTIIHPGHDAGPEAFAALEVEVTRNPALLANSLEAFRAAVERATGRAHH